ncbi:MAG: pyrroline-5-carboxylate reductase [Oscillospiraceae bacterium]|nr:pyrroline-5-carboxylate reductase [Oscillospiraceae bacterium]
MAYLFGFIGAGNMGGALARAAARTLDPARIVVSNRTATKAQALAAELGCGFAADNVQVAREAKYIFLGVKPQGMAGLLSELAPALSARTDRFILVSMAAGLRLDRLAALSGGDYPILRLMPNTAAAVGESVVLYTANDCVAPAEIEEFTKYMAGAGLLDPLDEGLIDAGSAVAGCGGAFCDLFLEALADGGVACGLPRAKALAYAAQMAVGAARLLLESGGHPGALKDAVCSPGGSTIQGVRALERGGFRSAVLEAVIAAYEKTAALGGS